MNALSRFLGLMERAFLFMANALILTMVAINLANIFSRLLFDVGIIWVFPWTGVLFVWIIFLSFYVIYRRGQDISVDYFVRKLPADRRALCAEVHVPRRLGPDGGHLRTGPHLAAAPSRQHRPCRDRALLAVGPTVRFGLPGQPGFLAAPDRRAAKRPLASRIGHDRRHPVRHLPSAVDLGHADRHLDRHFGGRCAGVQRLCRHAVDRAAESCCKARRTPRYWRCRCSCWPAT